MRIAIISALIVIVMVSLWVLRPSDLEVGSELHLGRIPQAVDGPALVAIQPWMDARHYQSADHLAAHLTGYLQTAREAGAMPQQSIVVFPEHIGTWLVAASSPRQGFLASRTDNAMTWLIASRPLPYIGALLRSSEVDQSAAALFRMRARSMASDYSRVFSQLADQYDITIVAGSIVLPDPSVVDGELLVGRGPLYNVSAVFFGDGRIAESLVRKVHPIPDEAGFTSAASAAALPVFETIHGRLGVLICADSWHPDTYAALESQNVDIIAVPAFLQPTGVWEEGWHGYTTGWPDDADREDEMRLVEREAWLTYALAGRMDETGASTGATAFLRGHLWDLGSDGANILVSQGQGNVAGDRQNASISATRLLARGGGETELEK